MASADCSTQWPSVPPVPIHGSRFSSIDQSPRSMNPYCGRQGQQHPEIATVTSSTNQDATFPFREKVRKRHTAVPPFVCDKLDELLVPFRSVTTRKTRLCTEGVSLHRHRATVQTSSADLAPRSPTLGPIAGSNLPPYGAPLNVGTPMRLPIFPNSHNFLFRMVRCGHSGTAMTVEASATGRPEN